MNKILFVSNTANFSKFNKPFMKWCLNQGWQVDYCAPSDEVVTDCSNHIVLNIPRSPFSKGILSCIRELRKILEKERFDIIHCHTPMGATIARLAAKKLFKKNQVKVIYTAHGFHFYKGAPLINWLLYYPVEKYLAKYTTKLITINKEDYERAKEKFAKYTDVLYMNGVGIDLSRFSQITEDENINIRNMLGYTKDDFIISVVAELNKNKNQSLLIKEIPKLKEVIPNLKVVFLGKETLPIARELAKKLDLLEVCQFMGYRRDVDLFEKICNICFSASLREGLPVNIIEGMACGKVCICSTNRGHLSLIESGKNGLIFDVNNPNQMVEDILKVYREKDFADGLSSTACKDAKQYDVKNAIDFTSSLYKSLIR